MVIQLDHHLRRKNACSKEEKYVNKKRQFFIFFPSKLMT